MRILVDIFQNFLRRVDHLLVLKSQLRFVLSQKFHILIKEFLIIKSLGSFDSLVLDQTKLRLFPWKKCIEIVFEVH